MAEIITGKKAMCQAIMRLQDAVQGQCRCGMETGFYSLDTLLGGIEPGQVMVLASRPGVGKSTFAVNLIHHLTAENNAKRILFCTGGASAASVALQLLMLQTGLSAELLHNEFSAEDIVKIADAAAIMKDSPLWIDPSWGMPQDTLIEKIRRQTQDAPLELCIIDGFQQLRFSQGEVSTQSFKALAEELKVPILLLYSQPPCGEKLTLPELPWQLVDNVDTIILMERKRREHTHRDRSVSVYFTVERNLCGATGIAEIRLQPDKMRFYNEMH